MQAASQIAQAAIFQYLATTLNETAEPSIQSLIAITPTRRSYILKYTISSKVAPQARISGLLRP